MLCQDILGITRQHTGQPGQPSLLPVPERLDRLHRRLGFVPLAFACLLWNFLSSMAPEWDGGRWVAIYICMALMLLPFKVKV